MDLEYASVEIILRILFLKLKKFCFLLHLSTMADPNAANEHLLLGRLDF